MNKAYARIKDKPFPAYEDLEILFSRTTATGRRGATSALPEGVSDNSTSDDEGQTRNFDSLHFRQSSQNIDRVSAASFYRLEDSDESRSDEAPNSPPACTSTPVTEPVSEGRPSSDSKKSRRSNSQTGRSCRSRISSDASDALQEIAEQGRRRLEIANELLRREKLGRPNVYSIAECMAKLESLPGITPECIIDAFEIFKNEDNRWFFMNYDGHVLDAWLRRQLSEFNQGPRSMQAPPASNVYVPNIYTPTSMHNVHRAAPNYFMNPFMNPNIHSTPHIFSSTSMQSGIQGGTPSFMDQVFRASTRGSPSAAHSTSTEQSSQFFGTSSSAPRNQSDDTYRHD